MKDILECYKTLGVEPGAAPERVRNAYLQLSRFYDPARYVEGDPEQLAKAGQKRKDIEEAYQAIRHFLPALQNPQYSQEPVAVQERDFTELVNQGPKEHFKTVVAIVLGTALALTLGWGYYIFRRTRVLPSAPVLIINPEDAATPASVVPSTASPSARE